VWLDLNSNEYSVYKKVGDQRAGKVVYPEFDVDAANYTGVEGPSPVALRSSVEAPSSLTDHSQAGTAKQ
jgi:hypothetical protein